MKALFLGTPPKVEVECIGKSKVSTPYQFGVEASIVTTNACAPDGLLPRCYATEKLASCELERVYVAKDAAITRSIRVASSSLVRSAAFSASLSELRRRSTADLKGRECDAANVILTAVGHIFAAFSPG
jgi:transposase, IS5 family